MNYDAIYELAKRIGETLPDMALLNNDILKETRESRKDASIRAYLKAMKANHYKIGNYLEEIGSHIYDGEIDNG